ncbi:MAG: hypothetical protein GIW99_03705 [Candidatus Eremiobacteraeota bacterium]|nr:hypothetical protein [Candidatus Eremiobacteraeota bacterium]MBC5826778.1 hypothetical protein [Candidatus Eremiobacteraeota bacterium]
MSADVAALCGGFEEIILRGMLTSAGMGRSAPEDPDADGDGDSSPQAPADGDMQSLFVGALASAIERSGGLGLGRALQSTLAHERTSKR